MLKIKKVIGVLILLSNGKIPIKCPICLGTSENCKKVCKKGFTWEKVYTGQVNNREKFEHIEYILVDGNSSFLLSAGSIPIICSKCSGTDNNCESCNNKGYNWREVFTGEVEYKEGFKHTVYEKQK